MANKSQPFDFETLVSSIKGLHDHLIAQVGKAVNISLTLRNLLPPEGLQLPAPIRESVTPELQIARKGRNPAIFRREDAGGN